MLSGVYWNQPVCPFSVRVSVCVENTSNFVSEIPSIVLLMLYE